MNPSGSPKWRTDYVSGQGRRAVYGTADGVYISDLWDPHKEPTKVLALEDVTQVDVLEEYQLLIVLSGMTSLTFVPIDHVCSHESIP